MKGNWKHKGKTKNKKKGNAVLQKYREAVDVFLKSKGGSEEAETDQRLRFVKKKSRKELRKEKRKMKKAKMKSHYEGKNTVSLPPSDEGNPKKGADKHQQPHTQKKKMEKTKKEGSKSHPSEPKDKSDKSETPPPSKKGKRVNKLQETRKLALMEANEQEDREIKKLERCLGLNKRKNKKSLPQSFVADGLDYILGVLDSGSSAVGLYEDDDVDMETAKENFKKLDDSQGSGEDLESEGEMASEGSDDDIDDDGEDEDDDMSNEEEADEDEEMEDDQEGLNDSGGPDSEDEKEGETEEETDAPDTKTETVSADICNIWLFLSLH